MSPIDSQFLDDFDAFVSNLMFINPISSSIIFSSVFLFAFVLFFFFGFNCDSKRAWDLRRNESTRNRTANAPLFLNFLFLTVGAKKKCRLFSKNSRSKDRDRKTESARERRWKMKKTKQKKKQNNSVAFRFSPFCLFFLRFYWIFLTIESLPT